MCSLHLTHPSAHTPGAVGSRHCSARGAVGGSVPCSRVSPQSWTVSARAGISFGSRSLFSGNRCYMRNLRRSLSKGNSTLRPLEGARGTTYQRSHAEG